MTEARRLLLIDWHFGDPRSTGGARWRAMATVLTSSGWSFDVITAGGASGAGTGEEWRPGIRLYVVPVPTIADDVIGFAARLRRGLRGGGRQAAALPPIAPLPPGAEHASRRGLYARLARLVNGVRLTVPEVGWTRRASRLAMELARAERYGAVIVSSPPHLTQLAGAAVARACRVPYVADFRDPWVFGRPKKYDVNPLANPLGRYYEARTLRRASLVIANTEHARRAVAEIYPELAARTRAVTNGYDADTGTPPDPDRVVFRIVFAGWLYPFMDPECVFAAAGRLRRRAGLSPDGFAVEFMGPEAVHRGVALASLAERHGIADCFRHHPHAPRADAARLQASAAVLVAFDQSTQLAMPTKFYDYARMGGVMLLVGFPDGALAAAAAALGLRVYGTDDADGMDTALDDALARWRARELKAPADRDGRFDRRLQAGLVNEALRSLGT